MMNHHGDINLSTIFRRNLDTHSQDDVSIKQGFLHQKYEKGQHRANVFLVDQKSALNLDDLVKISQLDICLGG